MDPIEIRSAALREQYESARTELQGLIEAGKDRLYTDDEKSRIGELKASCDQIVAQDKLQASVGGLSPATAPVVQASSEPASGTATLVQAAKPASIGDVQVTATAKTPYGADSKHSFFGDLQAMKDSTSTREQHEGAKDRLKAHYDATNDSTSARVLFTYSSTTDSEGGYLVAPTYLQEAFVEMLAAGRPTADLVTHAPLPPKTQTVNIPTQDGATAVAVHTQNNALTETTATFSTVAAAVARIGGAATVPNFLLDRSLPGADQVILRDLAKRYAVAVNDVVLNSTTTNRKGLFQASGTGGATITAGTATIADYWPKILNAVADVSAGVYQYPDAIIMHPRRWAWLAGQLDTASRPIIGSLNPQNAHASYNGMNVPASGQGPAPVGALLGIPVYLDAGIPTTFGAGTDEDRIIVGCMKEAWLMETAPKFAVSTEAEFLKDQTLLRVTGDVAFNATRRVAAFSIISGTGLNDTV